MEIFNDDLDFLEVIENVFPRRLYNRMDYFEDMDNMTFFKRFRLTKPTVHSVLQEIEDQLDWDHDREHGQGTQEETRSRDFRRELEEREKEKRVGGARPADHSSSKRLKLDQVPAASLDADDPIDPEDDSDSSDDEDDTEALLAELNKIKKERALEQTKKEIERRQEEERIRMENILSGNPLLTHYSSGGVKLDHKVKRRWDDDVVFKNCAKSQLENRSNIFINDSLRSEFHKKFMEKYVK